jgi:hypothetical protein
LSKNEGDRRKYVGLNVKEISLKGEGIKRGRWEEGMMKTTGR